VNEVLLEHPNDYEVRRIQCSENPMCSMTCVDDTAAAAVANTIKHTVLIFGFSVIEIQEEEGGRRKREINSPE
jgi:hypothetical protein